jgi:hypothetical protein
MPNDPFPNPKQSPALLSKYAIKYHIFSRPLLRMAFRCPFPHATAQAAADLCAPLIVCLSESGESARLVAKYKPAVPVVTLTPDEQTARHCMISRALFPVVVSKNIDEDALLKVAIDFGLTGGWLTKGMAGYGSACVALVRPIALPASLLPVGRYSVRRQPCCDGVG